MPTDRTEQTVEVRLDEALDKIEDARKLVGKSIPARAVEWAEKRGLQVQESEFAPPGQLYIVGAMPVFDALPMEWYE